MDHHDAGTDQVAVLERALASAPGDDGLRRRLALALHERALESCGVTRYRTRAPSTAPQWRARTEAARRMLALDVDAELNAAAIDLLAELAEDRREVRRRRRPFLLLAGLAVLVGVPVVVLELLAGEAGFAVLAALASGALVLAGALRVRREPWRVAVERSTPRVWRHGH
ncbi:hypothetical protein [Amycolatopsis nigrescens]|uniref:hypothetical protein n=1 Tax=Amycolatopsis nigrescens TaxID=381445 RepID=UPI0003784181|nr:hypothetical protein [Amycolatopsis nigrescens]